MSTRWYERHLLPCLLDCACGLSPIRRQRQRVVPAASGQVLEVGIGTGLNLPHYDRSRVDALVAIEPAERLHPRAGERSAASGIACEFVSASAEAMPFADACFDSLVCTYTLCTVGDPARAVREMRRVLKPGGQLLFVEHGIAPDPDVQRWQRRLEPLWSQLAGGCRLTRDIPTLLQDNGFTLHCETGYVARPWSLGWNAWGRAAPSPIASP